MPVHPPSLVKCQFGNITLDILDARCGRSINRAWPSAPLCLRLPTLAIDKYLFYAIKVDIREKAILVLLEFFGIYQFWTDV